MQAIRQFPPAFHSWFAEKGWQPRDYQLAMLDAYARHESTLLIAPTGGGKTLSGFLPALVDLAQQPQTGLHTLYISPLKALTNDIERNLLEPIERMQLSVRVETRTGDTPSHKRQRQRKHPPHILLTTPESLMLMLSYADAPSLFRTLKLAIIDETHSFAQGKRGDLCALALARLQTLAGEYVRFGLSATVAEPENLARWLGPAGKPAKPLIAKARTKPDITILQSRNRMPYSGFMAKYAMKEIYCAILEAGVTLVFVNTRAQAELIFQLLWDENSDALPIALYHGSLSKEQRRKTEALMASGTLRAIVSTSALELGIDWGNIDLVIQIGAPKGVSRLLQRIGRANHRLDEPSRALLVPANRFEALECQTALEAARRGSLDGGEALGGALEILPQYMVNCACSEPFQPDALYKEICQAAPYADLDRATFDQLLRFAVDGGYALQGYDRYKRLDRLEDGQFQIVSPLVSRRHRQNIGVIVEAGRLKVKRLRKAHQGRILGEVEEYFAQGLTPGDTFLFAGEVLAFAGVADMILEAWPASGGEPKIPSYVGGQMPLSTFLADGVRTLLDNPARWKILPPDVQEWLSLQARFSSIPGKERLLIEHFPYRKMQYSLFYTFEGRKANQTMGMLLTRRMERMGLKPVSFSVTDYGLSIASVEPLDASYIDALILPDLLGDDLEEWILDSPMLKRSFRKVATISGLTEQQYAGQRKTMKQVTFSTDLIYDVLRQYEPDHILLRVTRADAERELLDLNRLADLLQRFEEKTEFRALKRASPLAIPIVLDVRSEQVKGAGVEALLDQASLQAEAEQLIDGVREAVQL